jgi:LPS sulfotransferase NodH
MSSYYQKIDIVGGFDYALHRIPGLGGTNFRGPPVDLDRPFIAFVGAAQTFGRFSHTPFPSIMGERLGLPVLNLGVGGAGPRHFNRMEYLEILNKAELVVAQVLSGRSSSCTLFDNSRKGGMDGIVPFASQPMGVDDFYCHVSREFGQDAVQYAVKEMREDYLATFEKLLNAINPPKILLWLSSREPQYTEDYAKVPHGLYSGFPQLVNGQMVEELKLSCEAYVECISQAGLPQQLWAGDESMKGAVSRNGMVENQYYPSPEMHAEAADRLEWACRRYSGRFATRSVEPRTRFVVVGAERTGTNLLIGMLNQFPGIYCGGELFNSAQIAKGKLDWCKVPNAQLPRLLDLRISDPAALWRELSASSQPEGASAVGFKLLYRHGLANEALLDDLATDKGIRIVHLIRRNQLRRFVSERQARASRSWATKVGETLAGSSPVTISATELIKSFVEADAHRIKYDGLFARHQSICAVYEELAARPEAVASRVAQFLGLGASGTSIKPTFRKTGARDLSEVIDRFDALKAKFRLWSTYFDLPAQ